MRENDRRFFGDDSLSVFYEEMDKLKVSIKSFALDS